MKTSKILRISMIALLSALCLMSFCSAAVSVDDVTTVVGSQVTLAAKVADIEATSYQWYICDDAAGTNPEAIEGATGAVYTTSYLDAAEIYYYMVKVNGTEAAIAKVTANMPDKPVVFMFNNDADLSYWGAGATKKLVNIDGKTVFAYTPSSKDGATSFSSLSEYNDFYLRGYPYFVLSASYPEHDPNTFDIYIGADGYDQEYRDANWSYNFSVSGIKTPVNSGFIKIVVNAKDGSFKSYNAKGEVVSSGNGNADGFKDYTTLIGKLASFRLDFSNGNPNKECYIEYFGFFPTEEMAVSYSGEMPHDDDMNSIIEALDTAHENGDMDIAYESAATEASADAYIESLVEAITADAVDAIKVDGTQNVTVNISSTEYSPAENYWENGEYTFTVEVFVGDKFFQRSICEKTYTVFLKAKEMGNVFIPDASAVIGSTVTLTPIIADGITATSYQWYTCKDTDGTDSAIIEGATSAAYTTPYLNEFGSYFYKVVVNGTEEAVVAVSVGMPTEPVVFMFNNEYDLANWSAGSTKKLVNIDGKTAFAYTPNSDDGTTGFSNLASYNDFYLQGYPYFVLSASYPDHSNLTFDIYIGADGYDADYRKEHYNFNFAVTGVRPPVDSGFCKTVINAKDGSYKSYDTNGKVVASGTGSADGFKDYTTLIGKLATLRVDFSNKNKDKECYIEYFGFFPTEESALNYNGEMPEDNSANLLIDALEEAEASGKLSMRFVNAENETIVRANAAELVEQLTANTINELKEKYSTVEFTVGNATYSRTSPYGRGTYEFEAKALIGDKPFNRSLISTDVTMELREKPDPVVMEFDSEAKVTAASVGGVTTKSFVTEDGRTFMRLYHKGLDASDANVEIHYTSFYSQSGSTFNYQDYPYMKMSYRRDRAAGLDGREAIMLYTADNLGYYAIYPSANNTNPFWEQLIVDMRNPSNNAVTYYQEAANTTTTGKLATSGGIMPWTSNVIGTDPTPLEFRLSRYGNLARTIDIEYIVFFASENEAKMYPERLPENATYDVENLTAKNTFKAPAGVVTKAQAEAEADKYLDNFVFATNHNIDKENAVFTPPSSKAEGSYVFDVWFGTERKEEYTVAVTMTMDILPKPVIMFVDSSSVLSTLSADNAALKLENGVVKMTTTNPSNDDGFFLLTKYPGSMEQFKVNTLPYLKMRYTLSGITKDIDGNNVNPSSVQAQIFMWMSGSYATIPYRSYYPYDSDFKDGDEIEIIIDMSYVDEAKKGTDTVWVRNVTRGDTEYTPKKFESYRNEDNDDPANTKRNDNTVYTSVRLNLARTKNLHRYSEFYYAGYFASLDEAMAFDSDKETAIRLNEAQNKLLDLENSDVEIPWSSVAKEKTEIPDSEATLNADGSFDVSGVKTKTVTAMIGLKSWLTSYIGADGVVEITDYTAATETATGSISFNISLESGYQSKHIENVVATISKKPSGYIMWRFNDPELLSKISYSSAYNKVKIEDNLLKIEHKNLIDTGNFAFTVEPSDFGTENFLFEDYSYILMKYKRVGDSAPGALVFYNNEQGDARTINYLGWGYKSGDWYRTLYDTSIRDIVTNAFFNYNIESGTLDSITHCRFYSPPTTMPFNGTTKQITFNFGSRIYSSRYAEIEYIAFFPSMADARNYVENIEEWEDLVADTTVNLKSYTSDTVSFYDGNTESVAKAKAKALIEDKLLVKDVTVAVNTVSYTAPVLGTSDGAYVFTATVTKDGKTVYATGNVTLTIEGTVDSSEVIYRFANPEFITKIQGASDIYDYKAMTLEGYGFVLEIGSEKANIVSDVYGALKLDATFTDGFTAIINGNEEISYNGDADGAVCLELGKFSGNIDTIEIRFGSNGARVRALGFFKDIASAQSYDLDAVPAALTTAINNFKGTHNYAHAYAKTLSDAKAHTKATYLDTKISNADVTFAKIEYANYVHSTETETGSVDITATLAYGDRTATFYKDVSYTAILAKDEEVIKATPVSIGHEFLGWDTITATKNLAQKPRTVEFNIMLSEKRLGEALNIIKNGSFSVNVVNGKITAGTLTASTTLKADTWTHVAVTCDGKIYLDGVLDASGASIEFSTSAPVIGERFIGHLRDVRFWSDVRTASEITANMDTRTDNEGLLANWMLTADSYKWLEYRDSSEFGNTATFKSTGWYKMEAGLQGDYSIIHFGDTQSHFASVPRSFKRLPDMFEWLANNKEKYNIGHVSILGDATQNNTIFEWGVIREAFNFIEGKIPYHISLGNHDYPSPYSGLGAEIRDPSNYRNIFDYDTYAASYGTDTFGTFRDEKELTNMYNLVTIGDVDYILFALEFSPRDVVLDWVGEVLTQYPERQAIISTHCYFNMDGTLTTESATLQFPDGNEGIDIYNDIVTKYPNVIIVDCGHTQGDDTKQHPHNRGSGYLDSPTADDFGNDVVQILADASAYAMNYPDGTTYDFGSSDANMVAFGADEGLIFVMMFEDGGRTMHTYIYSPLHNSFFRSVNEQTHTIKEIKTQPSLNVVGTELREQTTEQSLGMRFKMTLSKSFANFDDKIEVLGYGVVVVPEDIMEEGMEVTADMLQGTENAKFVKVEECSDTIFYEDDSKIDFTVVIHSVPETAYSRQFKARAYVDYTVNGGEVQRLYSFKTLTCSMNSLIND